MNREELLTAIRKIVGRKFQFSEAYAKKCGGYPTLGANERTYSILTKKYVYIPCRVTFGRNAEGEVGSIMTFFSISGGKNQYVSQKLRTNILSAKSMLTYSIK